MNSTRNNPTNMKTNLSKVQTILSRNITRNTNLEREEDMNNFI